jgi:translation initiation factor IF-2
MHGANPKKVENQLKGNGLKLDKDGGDTLHVNISAKRRMHLDKLEEAILFQAELMDLRADSTCLAQGTVIESKVRQGRGSVCTVLIQRGTLRVGDNLVMGTYTGKVRAMFNDLGTSVKTAAPSEAVELSGLKDIPEAGEIFLAVASAERAKELATYRDKVVQNLKASEEEKTQVAELPKL